MLVIPQFQPQIAALREDLFRSACIAGLEEGLLKARPIALRRLSQFLDVPERFIKDLVGSPHLLRYQEAEMRLSDRILIETEMARLGVVGPKWAAIRYGVDPETLRNVLKWVSEGGMSMRIHALEILSIWDRMGVVDSLKLKYVVDAFLQYEGSTIFTSKTEEANYLLELCNTYNIDCTLVRDAHGAWVEAVRRSLDKQQVQVLEDTATTFCAFSGLPIAHYRAEYLALPKPGILEPDSVAWFAIFERPVLGRLIADHDPSRRDEFTKYAFM